LVSAYPIEGLLPFSDRSVARICGAVTFAVGLLLLFLASALSDTHAAGAADFIFPSGVAFAALSPLVWRGARWAMSLSCFVAVGLALAAINNSPSNQWLFLSLPLALAAVAFAPHLHGGVRWAIGCLLVAAGFMLARGSLYEARYVLVLPALFGGLLLAHAAARPAEPESVTPPSSVAARIFAVLVYAYGTLVVVLAPLDHTNALGAPIVASYALALGTALGALCIFVWRGDVWAMGAVCLLTLAQWLMLAQRDPIFWAKAAYFAALALFAALTAVCVATSRARTRRS
jgi:hypothetical protein